MRGLLALLLAAAPALVSLDARAADLVIWWEKGFTPQEAPAFEELVAAYAASTGQQVELTFWPSLELRDRIATALAEGRPPDLSFGTDLENYVPGWARGNLLADVSDVVLPSKREFLPGLLDYSLLEGPTGVRAFYSVPLAQTSLYVHVWKSLLEMAGLTLDDVPREWDAFWSFWCDRVQPAVRKATGREDIWGLGLPMSAKAGDGAETLTQFMWAHGFQLARLDGTPMVNDPAIGRSLTKVLSDYTGFYAKGCVPPDAVDWNDSGNNQAFLDQRAVMVVNPSFSIPNALRARRAEDYYINTATIDWPEAPSGQTYPMVSYVFEAIVFREGQHVEAAKEFLGSLLTGERLGIWLGAAGGRFLPTMPAQLAGAHWSDLADPHRRAALEQLAQPGVPPYGPFRSPIWDKVYEEGLLQKAIYRVAADGVSPEQAVDELIARIGQIETEAK